MFRIKFDANCALWPQNNWTVTTPTEILIVPADDARAAYAYSRAIGAKGKITVFPAHRAELKALTCR